MKLKGFRVHRVEHGVEVLELATIDLPLDHVLRSKLVSAETRASKARPRDPRGPDVQRIVETTGPVGYRLSDGSVRRLDPALVLGVTLTGLTDFLVDRYEPLASGQLEAYLRRARAEGEPRGLIRQEVERICSRRGDMSELLRFRRRARVTALGSPILRSSDDEEQPVTKVETEQGLCAFLQAPNVALWHEDEAHVGGRPVPRCRWALVPDDTDEPVLFFDGSLMRTCRSVDDLPVGFLERVERDGTVLGPAELPQPLMGAPELEPRFLLRIPPAADLEAASEKKPRNEILEEASFLFDSRSTISIPGPRSRIPFLEDPRAARWVLARTNRAGFFLPTATPSETVPAWLAGDPAGRVLVGAIPVPRPGWVPVLRRRACAPSPARTGS